MIPSPVKYRTEKNDLYTILKKDVNEYLLNKANNQYADTAMIIKIFLCITLFAITYVQYINTSYSYLQWLGWCLLFGFCNMLLGVNIAHDAIHQALFKKKWLNKLAGFSFDLIGISSYTWKIKHNYIHHNYPNVINIDVDIEAGPLLRFSPGDKKRWFHRYQHLYAPLIYILFSLHLVFINDILILMKRRYFYPLRRSKFIRVCMGILVQKIFYLFYILIVPCYLLSFPWWQVICGFILMHFTLSFFLALVLLPSHLFEKTTFSDLAANGHIDEDWTIHQFRTTLDFASQSHLVHFLCGGFNTNVVHHLFPAICHCHYKKLSSIIAQRTGELNITYHHLTLKGAIASHFKALKILGTNV